ncbi:MAG: oxidative damage protection protein [Cardiobacteriaceae bacterium]|nr:oxidative damage protection protein [Cardiobacteriaceae bacterium]
MSDKVFCVKLQREGTRLPRKPVAGELGERILQHISREAWDMWLNQQTMLINEHRLTSFDPEARAFLQEKMESFLFENQKVEPEQYRPQGKV